MSGFSHAVLKFSEEAKKSNEEVLRRATANLVRELKLPGPTKTTGSTGEGGAMPLFTAHLRSSLRASMTEMPTIDPNNYGPGVGVNSVEDETQTTGVIAGFGQGQILYLGFTAAYALKQNYGFGTHQGYLFVERAGGMWPELVREAREAVGR